VAGFPAFTDNHVRQPIVDGLLRRGWKVVRSVDTLGEAVDDDILFDYAAREELVARMSDGDFIAALDEIARKPNAFAYPIEYITPKG
jgi:hypothetical protein